MGGARDAPKRIGVCRFELTGRLSLNPYPTASRERSSRSARRTPGRFGLGSGIKNRAGRLDSVLSQQQVYNPAAPDVRPRPPTVGENGGAVATSFLQRIGQDGESVE